jgi:hypothetical protein
MIPAIFLFTVWGSAAARADIIVETPGFAVTAIDDITIAGSTYDLTFTTTALTPYAGAPTGIASVDNQIRTDLFGNFAETLRTAGGSLGSGVILWNSTTTPCGTGAFECGVDGDLAGDWTTESAPANFLCTPGSANCGTVYADFTPVAATPEPGTLTLALTGLLGLILVMRKRKAPGLPQAS